MKYKVKLQNAIFTELCLYIFKFVQDYHMKTDKTTSAFQNSDVIPMIQFYIMYDSVLM